MNKKQIWKPGNMLYPVPAVMVSCGDAAGKKKYNYGSVDGNDLFRPCDGVDFRASGEVFVLYDRRDGRVCD